VPPRACITWSAIATALGSEGGVSERAGGASRIVPSAMTASRRGFLMVEDLAAVGGGGRFP
jgi:hypothetical protein